MDMHVHVRTMLSQVVMVPHEQAEEFISSYLKLIPEDLDVNNFQKVLEMKVQLNMHYSGNMH